MLKWCQANNIKLISTCLESRNGKLTGSFLTPDCSGEEKVKRIKEMYFLEQYEKIYAYGDTKSDLPMLELADYKFYRRFW
jgi:phosphoserine phosphatase